jgi:hypothetical protein
VTVTGEDRFKVPIPPLITLKFFLSTFMMGVGIESRQVHRPSKRVARPRPVGAAR